MPNSWQHHRPEPDASCIAPVYAPYGRWNIDEIVYAAFPAVFLITLWRVVYTQIFNVGWAVVVPMHFPDPHPQPAFVNQASESWKVDKLRRFYNKIELKKSRVPKRKKKQESEQEKCDMQLTANIKRRNEGASSTARRGRKTLKLPAGLETPQSAENLAFLASLDGDETRSEIPLVMKEISYSLSQVREYCHYRKDYDAMKELAMKFNEESWKMMTMFFVTIYGVYVMTQEPFFSDPALLFKAWPQIESWRVFLYYQIAVGYHVHRAVWQFWGKNRKDVVAMFIHHWVTVMLVGGSWYWGIMNIGAVVMVLHDNADIFLPAAKIARWMRWDVAKNVCFVLFAASWIVSRIGFFAWKVIVPVFMYAPTAYSCHFSKFVMFASGLVILLFLHFYWAHLIVQVSVHWICFGQTVTDNRSSGDDNEEEIIIEPEEFANNDVCDGDGDGGICGTLQNAHKLE